jgi:hypothetical protein
MGATQKRRWRRRKRKGWHVLTPCRIQGRLRFSGTLVLEVTWKRGREWGMTDTEQKSANPETGGRENNGLELNREKKSILY